MVLSYLSERVTYKRLFCNSQSVCASRLVHTDWWCHSENVADYRPAAEIILRMSALNVSASSSCSRVKCMRYRQ